jgi:hypothetical protein
MTELYAAIRRNHDEGLNVKFGHVEQRLKEAESVGYGFDLPKNPSKAPLLYRETPNVPKCSFERVAVSA